MKDEKTLLVVEDEMSLLKVIELQAKKKGFSTLTARSVQEAVDHLESAKNIHAIWLDHYLLGNDSGLDFVHIAKADDSKWKRVPIFVISNTASQEKVATYLKLGVSKYVTKSNYKLTAILDEIIGHIDEE